MKRREFIAGLAGAAAWPLAGARSRRVVRLEYCTQGKLLL